MHEDTRQAHAFIRHFNVLNFRMRHQTRRFFEAIDGALVSRLTRLGLRMHEAFADLIVVRGTAQKTSGGQRVALGRLGVSNRLDARGFARPFVEPRRVVIRRLVFQSKADTVDLIYLRATPRRAGERNQQAVAPAVVAGKIIKGEITLG